ncbi:MAG: DUF2142 domain-containing protein [Rhodopila sp.]
MRRLRAAQTLNSFGEKLARNDAGGRVDIGAAIFSQAFSTLNFHPERKLTSAMVEPIKSMHWNNQARGQAGFGNTVAYAPFGYGFAVSGILSGKMLHLTILRSFLLARLFNGIGTVLLCALAIGVARRGRMLLFALLSLPMSLFLFASCSQDALIIAFSALACAWITRLVEPEAVVSRWEWLIPAVLIGMASASKIVYCSLTLLLAVAAATALPPARNTLAKTRFIIVLIGLSLVIPVLWQVYGAMPVTVTFRAEDNVLPAGQLHYLANHPADVPGIATATFKLLWWLYIRQFIGVLGWLDTDLSPWFYHAVPAVLLLILLVTMLGPDGSWRGQVWLRLSVLAAACLATVATFAALYLIWSPVGSPIVEGVQGRYFLPIALWLPLLYGPAVPSRPWLALPVRPAWLLVALVPIMNFVELPLAIMIRYYW